MSPSTEDAVLKVAVFGSEHSNVTVTEIELLLDSALEDGHTVGNR